MRISDWSSDVCSSDLPDEAAVRTKRPAMINAAMRLRIARLAKTHLHPAMRTHVQRYMNLALTITRHNHIVLAHVANNEIPRLRYLRLMTQQQPRLRETPFHLQPVQLLVGHYPQGYLVHLPVNQIIQRRAATQHQPSILQHDASTHENTDDIYAH